MRVHNLLGQDCKSYHNQLSNLTDEEQKLVYQSTYSQDIIRLKNKLTEIKTILKGLADGSVALKGGKWLSVPYELNNPNLEMKLLPTFLHLENENDGDCCQDAIYETDDCRYLNIEVFVSENTIKKVLELESVNLENKINEYTEKLNAL